MEKLLFLISANPRILLDPLIASEVYRVDAGSEVSLYCVVDNSVTNPEVQDLRTSE